MVSGWWHTHSRASFWASAPQHPLTTNLLLQVKLVKTVPHFLQLLLKDWLASCNSRENLSLILGCEVLKLSWVRELAVRGLLALWFCRMNLLSRGSLKKHFPSWVGRLSSAEGPGRTRPAELRWLVCPNSNIFVCFWWGEGGKWKEDGGGKKQSPE